MEKFAERLAHERKLQGYTQRQFAEHLGIPHSTYKGYEILDGKNKREPSLEMILKIATTLNVSIDILFGKDPT